MKTQSNKIGQPLILMSYAIVLLLIISLFKLPVGMFNGHPKIDILVDIRKDTQLKLAISTIIKEDTVSFSKNIHPPKDFTLIADYGFDYANSLKGFYQKLDGIKKTHSKVRIAYFGDSYIEGDHVTSQIRQQMQKMFGGSGIGFMPMASAVAGLYKQISLSGAGWLDYNFKNNPNGGILGLSGHVFYPYGNAAAIFSARTSEPLNVVKLYTGQTAVNAKVEVAKDGKSRDILINGSKTINETVLNSGSPIKTIKISSTDENLPVYGVSIEDKEGVYLDNYSFRGNSGAWNLQINKETMSQLNSYLHYDLIVMQYGINAVEHDKQKSPWFENSMNVFIKTMKKAFPNVPILLVSTSDMGHKYEGKYLTEKAVPYMVATQRQIARNNKIAFWNLFEAMGGDNTMVNWVEGDTVLAAKDYIHLNDKGAVKVGDLFFNKLMESKNYYQQHTLTKK
ncbi:GDSL-type esterase/lipase family protein [Parasediminibacterium sp. JCM 36343]|uniref:GDSL-type esterase/lipase family protein n=1 Tax=Parasediminibacterium sp. JCM 36343 TaxID=3374279 RepID=UPI0039783406